MRMLNMRLKHKINIKMKVEIKNQTKGLEYLEIDFYTMQDDIWVQITSFDLKSVDNYRIAHDRLRHFENLVLMLKQNNTVSTLIATHLIGFHAKLQLIKHSFLKKTLLSKPVTSDYYEILWENEVLNVSTDATLIKNAFKMCMGNPNLRNAILYKNGEPILNHKKWVENGCTL